MIKLLKLLFSRKARIEWYLNKRMMNCPKGIQPTLILKVEKKDYDNCGQFYSPFTCLLATAAKRQFEDDTREHVVSIQIGIFGYSHCSFDWREWQKAKSVKAEFTVALW